MRGKSKMNSMSEKSGVWLLATLLLATVSNADAQQPKKVTRIGYLSSFDPASESDPCRGNSAGSARAWLHRRTEHRHRVPICGGEADRLPELAAELVRLKVDIIVVAGGGRAIRAAKKATKTIPIVMVGAGVDPVEAGLVESLARPGGNVTGITNITGQLGGKRLELLKEAVPKVARVAVLYDPASSGSVLEVKEVLPAAARALGLTIRSWEVRDADGFEKVFAALSKERPDGLYVTGAAR